MKKPDGTTVITPEGFRTQLADLPADALLGVGRSTKKALNKYGIYTIGQLAACNCLFLEKALGKAGASLWSFANGLDCSKVVTAAEAPPVKSVGHGTTPPRDLTDNEQVKCLMLALCQEIGEKLRRYHMRCHGVSITLKDKKLMSVQHQGKLNVATNNSGDIAKAAYRLFMENGGVKEPLRAVTVTAINLENSLSPQQIDIFTDFTRLEKRAALDKAVDGIRKRFGKNAIYPASVSTIGTVFSSAGLSLPTTQT